MTEKLYHIDPALMEFDARILRVTETGDGCDVVLDRTCFYPGGGGQPADTGTLGAARVREIALRGDEIIHRVDSGFSPREPGAPVRGVVDAVRRRDFMAQHTGQHVVSQALVRAGRLETVSVRLGDDDTTIELAAESIDDEILREAEDIANGVIKENRRVIAHEIDRSELSRFPLRRTPPEEARLRIVEVEGFDWAACGGVHVAGTGEVFLVKAVGAERIRGRIRLHVMIGRRAFEDYGRKIAIVQGLSRALTCGEPFLEARVDELIEREKRASREVRRLRLERASTDADEAAAGAPRIGPAALVRGVFDDAGPDYMKAFVERVTASPGRAVVAVDRKPDGFTWAVAHSLGEALDLSPIVSPLLATAGVKGGGSGARMQGSAGAGADPDVFVEAVAGALTRRLAGGNEPAGDPP